MHTYGFIKLIFRDNAEQLSAATVNNFGQHLNVSKIFYFVSNYIRHTGTPFVLQHEQK